MFVINKKSNVVINTSGEGYKSLVAERERKAIFNDIQKQINMLRKDLLELREEFLNFKDMNVTR